MPVAVSQKHTHGGFRLVGCHHVSVSVTVEVTHSQVVGGGATLCKVEVGSAKPGRRIGAPLIARYAITGPSSGTRDANIVDGLVAFTTAGFRRIDCTWTKLTKTRLLFFHCLPYGASKAGLCQLTRAMAEAWSRDRIMCNAIAPGFFPTDLTAKVFEDAQVSARFAEQTAVGRNGELEDLRGATVFLAAPASNYITGQVLAVDGGFTAR